MTECDRVEASEEEAQKADIEVEESDEESDECEFIEVQVERRMPIYKLSRLNSNFYLIVYKKVKMTLQS